MTRRPTGTCTGRLFYSTETIASGSYIPKRINLKGSYSIVLSFRDGFFHKLCIYTPIEVGLDFLTQRAFNKLVAFTSLSKSLTLFHKFNAQIFYRNYCFWILHS
jgi:hypothetical protein